MIGRLACSAAGDRPSGKAASISRLTWTSPASAAASAALCTRDLKVAATPTWKSEKASTSSAKSSAAKIGRYWPSSRRAASARTLTPAARPVGLGADEEAPAREERAQALVEAGARAAQAQHAGQRGDEHELGLEHPQRVVEQAGRRRGRGERGGERAEHRGAQ